jgi:hypothetical protein
MFHVKHPFDCEFVAGFALATAKAHPDEACRRKGQFLAALVSSMRSSNSWRECTSIFA